MRKAAEKKTAAPWLSADGVDLDRYIPEELRNLDDLQTEIPRLAKPGFRNPRRSLRRAGRTRN